MKFCGMAGSQCPNEATSTVRLANVGDRSVCSTHLAWMTQVGMDFRVLEPNAFVPAWRKSGIAKDFTRSIA